MNWPITAEVTGFGLLIAGFAAVAVTADPPGERLWAIPTVFAVFAIVAGLIAGAVL